MRPIYHIIDLASWEAAQRAGVYAPPSLSEEGFIHFSRAEQLAGTARRFYAGRDDLLLLTVDAPALGEALRMEAAADGFGVFPHLYTALSLDAVTDARPLRWQADGELDLTDLPS